MVIGLTRTGIKKSILFGPILELFYKDIVMKKKELSDKKRQLLKLMQTINFGRIEGLTIRGGAPLLTPPPRVVREFKFGGENGQRPEATKHDFTLKMEVCELFAQLVAMGDGLVISLEIKHGLPFRMTIEEVPA